MEIFYEQIPLPEEKSFIIREFWNEKLTFPFHNHPFYELNMITNGSGKRMVGNRVSYFEEGDLSLMGPDLPHQFADDETATSKTKYHSLIIQFHADLIPDKLISRDDFYLIDQLLKNAKRGICFSTKTQKEAQEIMQELLNTKGFPGFLLFLKLLHLLSVDNQTEFLSNMDLPVNTMPKGLERTRKIFEYVYTNYTGEISIEKAASLINLSIPAFSHFFKKRANKTFSTFVNELRVSHASRLLRETDHSVTEICYQSGFNNLSYFNRQFKQINKLTPLKFRNTYGIRQ